MKTLIVYCSSHGTAEKAARILSENLEGEVLAVDLRRDKVNLNPEEYDTVIIGGSIHAGSIQGKVKHFIVKYHDLLLDKDLGLFLCCMRRGDTAIEQFNQSFPINLRKNSVAMGLFGGELLVSKMNFFERQVVKRVDGVTEDVSDLDIRAIMEFASRMNSRPVLV
ncbi:flavodoxin domain-containing protein [Neobacillus muris]|uniref:flavodoxin domain-containing protein n=1 Tax=Neobacillus muris TaxID=2941334 RepID=UPI00203DA1D8|nr:flavodoxin domain-containing protein [Neobacillus muris]